mgnify:CR=1 FL=1
MNSRVIIIILASTLFFLQGCDLTFKRKTSSGVPGKVEMAKETGSPTKSNKPVKNIHVNKKSVTHFRDDDIQRIREFYKENTQTRDDMIAYSKLSKKQKNSLVVNGVVKHDIQIIPLPLKLKEMLSPLPMNLLRVHAGDKVILMNVNSRRIIDIIKL